MTAMSTPPFVHLRLHSEYSITDGIARIDDAVAAAKADGMPALALIQCLLLVEHWQMQTPWAPLVWYAGLSWLGCAVFYGLVAPAGVPPENEPTTSTMTSGHPVFVKRFTVPLPSLICFVA